MQKQIDDIIFSFRMIEENEQTPMDQPSPLLKQFDFRIEWLQKY